MNIKTIIDTLYKSHKQSFISSYGGDIVISALIIIIFIYAITYFYIINYLPTLKQSWPQNRCNPLYMPFAGIVQNDSEQSANKAINDNFNGCIHNILHTVSEDALAPIHHANKITSNLLEESTNSINSMRSFFDKTRNNITNITENIMGRTLNVTIPPIHMAITTKDSLSKVKGAYTVGIYFLISNYLLMKSLIKNIISTIVNIIISLVGTIVGLLLIPFEGPGLASPLIAIADVIIPPTVYLINKVNKIFKLNISSELPHW